MDVRLVAVWTQPGGLPAGFWRGSGGIPRPPEDQLPVVNG